MIENQTNEKQYGINQIYRLHSKISKDKFVKNSEFLESMDAMNITIVKCEYTKENFFMLLSDGRVISKGKEKVLGREENIDPTKKYGQVVFETDETNVMIYNISAGDEHVLALDQNYNLWGWGDNWCLQVHPYEQKKDINKPIQIKLPGNAQPVQIFALQRSSMVVCKNNLIYMWGSLNEGYLTDYKSEGNIAKEFVQMKNLTAFIFNEINKNDDDISDTFINSRKLFNVKYNQTLKENSDKINSINKIKTQIENLKVDIEQRKSQMIQASSNNLNSDTNDKRIIILNNLLKSYEEKLNRISLKKENFRKQLIQIEEDINQKDIDIKALTEQIDSIDDKMENFNNEITQLKENSKEDPTLNEKSALMSSLKIHKESLMNNMQVIIELLEGKEKERKLIADQIIAHTKKEDSYLKARYTLEDMITVLWESLKNNSKDKKAGAKKNSSQGSKKDPNTVTEEKIKEKFLELFEFHKNIEKFTFIELNNLYPYKTIDDLLKISYSEINSIKNDIATAETTLSEVVKNSLQIIFDIIYNKIDLIEEQNFMIKSLYNILTNLDSEIHHKILNDSQVKIGNSSVLEYLKKKINKSAPDMETIYKELILSFLKDASSTGDKESKVKSTQDELDRIEKEKRAYLEGKQEVANMLKERSLINKDLCKNINLEDMVSFGNSEYDSKNNNGCIII
jgi:hypothetical protein